MRLGTVVLLLVLQAGASGEVLPQCPTGTCGVGIGIGTYGQYGSSGIGLGVGGWRAVPAPPQSSPTSIPTLARPAQAPGWIALLTARQRSGGKSDGNGTGSLVKVIGTTGYLLTAEHVTSGAQAVDLRLNGKTFSGTVHYENNGSDYAIVKFDTGGAVLPVMPVASTMLSPGETVWWGGFSGGTQYVETTGRVIASQPRTEITGGAPFGTSGGPVWNRNGVVSVISETMAPSSQVNDPNAWTIGGPPLAELTSAVSLLETFPVPGQQMPPIVLPGPSEGDVTPVLAERVDALEAEIAKLREMKLLPGPKGDPGPKGPAGPAGPAGKDADPKLVEGALSRLGVLETGQERQSRTVAEAIAEIHNRLDGAGQQNAVAMSAIVNNVSKVDSRVAEVAAVAARNLPVSEALSGVLTAFGWTCPPAFAGAIALKMLLGYLARKRQGGQVTVSVAKPQSPVPQAVPLPEQRPIVIHDTAPPPPQVTVREKEFVEVQVPTKRQVALERAISEYVTRYPGSRGAVQAIEEYARQIESGL